MNTKFSCQCDTSAEEEQHVEDVENRWYKLVEGHFFLEADCNGVEECKHREDSHKHGVVDDRWVSGSGGLNDITSDGHDNQGEQELTNVSDEPAILILNKLT